MKGIISLKCNTIDGIFFKEQSKNKEHSLKKRIKNMPVSLK